MDGISDLNKNLIDILKNYERAKKEEFAGHPLKETIKSKSESAIYSLLNFSNIKVKGSAGQGNWAKVPWIAIMDNNETTSTQEGLYVVFLFNIEEKKVYLTLDQGISKLDKEYKKGEVKEILRKRSEKIAEKIDSNYFNEGIIKDLPGRLGEMYGYGAIIHKKYSLEDLEQRNIEEDLKKIIELYENYIERKDIMYSQENKNNVKSLLSYAEENKDKINIFRVTGPVDHWITAVRRKVWGVNKESSYSKIQKGDILIFHSTKTTQDSKLSTKESGIIGAGIVSKKETKNKPWWWAEYEEESQWKFILHMDPMWITGSPKVISDVNIMDKSVMTREKETYALLENFMPMEKASEICETINDKTFPTMGSFSSFRDSEDKKDKEAPLEIIRNLEPLSKVSDIDQSEDIRQKKEKYETKISPDEKLDIEIGEGILDHLHFPGGSEKIVDQVESALMSGQNIIFTGPPGTGKTEIARKVSEFLAGETGDENITNYKLTTATSDWSTFDTVGGYMPESGDGSRLVFNPGTVLKRFPNGENPDRNELLVIDEINRADIDKAFGQLFTVLSGQEVSLPFETEKGDEIEIVPADEGTQILKNNRYVVPESWRILATMNTYDKTSLYEMSYAFMRRFSFIRIDCPEIKGPDQEGYEEFIDGYLNVWRNIDFEPEDEAVKRTVEVWKNTNSPVDGRDIGPSIVRDILKYVENHPKANENLGRVMKEAVVSYIFPQLEGVPDRKKIIVSIAESKVFEDVEEPLKQTAREMLQVELDE